LQPRLARAWANLALLHVRQGEPLRAVAAFREIMPEPEAYYSAGYLCLMHQRYDEAQQLFQQAIERAPSYYADARQGLDRARLAALASAPTAAGR
jgi:tetratricopeptide (TPR) repeat protein